MKKHWMLIPLAILMLAQPGALLLADIQNQPSGPSLDVDVDVNKDAGGGQWYANPVWLAIGGLALLLVIALVVMAARGGGSTVVASK
jgi:hypothetical protein